MACCSVKMQMRHSEFRPVNPRKRMPTAPPSAEIDLFLKIYCDVLATLDTNPWAGVVSPPLLGLRGVVNLSIISHSEYHYDCIVRAESEVFLALNFWQTSKSASKICDALLELSRRAMKKGKKVVVEMMYGRANLKVFTKSHVIVDDAEMASDEVKPPKRSDIPGIDFELVNFHQHMCPPHPLLNTRYRPPEGGYKFGMNNEYATTWILDGSKGAEPFKTLQLEAGGIHDGDVDKGGKEDPASLGLEMQESHSSPVPI
ncbi:hypothetical protein EV702DRAFT_1193993 [Suillus placidus]|uniref:Uncharacterized protein n=1 Tax=Suillus placidus TaxID=48579 RepID=A0A9P7A112_9AGAM|nr:hypothetical protein EV702DRAFT_1193993 [Suillus placidus]